MRQFILASLIIGAACGQAAAGADNPPPNVDIVSVVPRSPDVKPYMMSLPAEGRPEHAVIAHKPANPPPGDVTEDHKSGRTTLASE